MADLPVFIWYIFASTLIAFRFWFFCTRYFGLSGNQMRTMAIRNVGTMARKAKIRHELYLNASASGGSRPIPDGMTIHASPATVMLPIIQKVANALIMPPRFDLGWNSAK